jgi:hypothetical protein
MDGRHGFVGHVSLDVVPLCRYLAFRQDKSFLVNHNEVFSVNNFVLCELVDAKSLFTVIPFVDVVCVFRFQFVNALVDVSSESHRITEVFELVSHIACCDDDCSVVEHPLHESLVDKKALTFLKAQFSQLPADDSGLDDNPSCGDDVLSVLPVEMDDNGTCDDGHEYDNATDDHRKVRVVSVCEVSSDKCSQYYRKSDSDRFPENKPMQFSAIYNRLVRCEVTFYKSHFFLLMFIQASKLAFFSLMMKKACVFFPFVPEMIYK